MTKLRRYREGDFLETQEGLLFHVKGILHPPERIIAFLRYVPDRRGRRVRKGTRYRKIYPLEERFEYLRKNHPKYLFYSEKLNREVQSVPLDDVRYAYRPQDRLRELEEGGGLSVVERAAVELSDKLIGESGVDARQVGVTGSILAGLQRADSDLDLVVYGGEEGRKIYSTLVELRKSDEHIRPYDESDAMRVAKFRWGKTGLPLKKMASIEREKVLHGLMEDRDFFIRLVKDWGDVNYNYDDFTYFQVGKSKIEGLVTTDEQSIFTPNKYSIDLCRTLDGDSYDVREIVSYRGRFAEQAVRGETITSYGRVEEVVHDEENYYRMLLGKPEEYLISLDR